MQQRHLREMIPVILFLFVGHVREAREFWILGCGFTRKEEWPEWQGELFYFSSHESSGCFFSLVLIS
jgi:hypothetical protein